MTNSSASLGDRIRTHRRRADLTQEQLAERSGYSVSTVRNLENGRHDARTETLRAIASALGVDTQALIAADEPHPAGPRDDANRRNLMELRRALMPPIGMSAPMVPVGVESAGLDALDRDIDAGHTLYHADKYAVVARNLPDLLRQAETAVTTYEAGPERDRAEMLRLQALRLAGTYLTQVRQYDMAYHALGEVIRLSRERGDVQMAATGVVGMCWLLLRQDRFAETEQLASQTAAMVEPSMGDGTPEQFAVWGELWLRVAAAAIRNGRQDVNTHARAMAKRAAGALGVEHLDRTTHWSTFGPVTAHFKAVEDAALTEDWRQVVRESASDDAMQTMMQRPTSANFHRHLLDVANAHVHLGDTTEAMNTLTRVNTHAPGWIRHQPLARYVMADLLSTRKRTVTGEMREMADHLGVSV